MGWIVLAILLSAPGWVTLTLVLLPETHTRHRYVAQAASFIHLGLVAWLAVLLTLLLGLIVSRRVAPAVAALPVIVALGVQMSWWWHDDEFEDVIRTHENVAMVNLAMGVGAMEEFLDDPTPRDSVVSVYVFVEATDELIARVDAAGLAQTHPYSAGEARSGPGGTVIRSSRPLTEIDRADTTFVSPLVRVRGNVPGDESQDLLIAGVHPMNPMAGAGPWARDAAALRTMLARHIDAPVLVIGDFNAISRHKTMLDLAEDGWRNCNRGPDIPTWPVGFRVPPKPVIGIDHALVSPGATCGDPDVFEVPHADHRGLLVRAGVRH